MIAMGQSRNFFFFFPCVTSLKAIELFHSGYILYLSSFLSPCRHDRIYTTTELREQAFYPTELSSTVVPNHAYCASRAAN